MKVNDFARKAYTAYTAFGLTSDFTFQYVSINTRSSEPPINSSILYHILSTMVFFYLFIYFDITRFTGSTILLMFFTFVDLS